MIKPVFARAPSVFFGCCFAFTLCLVGCGDDQTAGNDAGSGGSDVDADITPDAGDGAEDASTREDAGGNSEDAGNDAGLGGPEDAGHDSAVPSECGDGEITGDETCDTMLMPCCNATCTGIAAQGVVCRAANGTCDVAEVCDGATLGCGDDEVADDAHECRASAGLCDQAELCDGTSKLCPSDAKRANRVECRAAVGECDVAEYCDGSIVDCPNDGVAADDFECRAATDLCDVAELCDGENTACPDDVVESDTSMVCRAADGACDVADTCDGTTTACVNVFRGASFQCRASVDACDKPETCTGSDAACPSNLFADAGVSCGDATDCALEECDGSGACEAVGDEAMGTACGDPRGCTVQACGADGNCNDVSFVAAGSACGPDTDCLHAACDGTGACVDGGDAVDGSPCEDGDACVGGDRCLAGACTAGTLPGRQIFYDDFSPGAAWLLDADWDIGTTVASTTCDTDEGFSQDPAADHSAGNDDQVGGVSLGGCVEPTVHPFYCMTSPVIATSVASQSVSFNFWRWLNADYIDFEDDYMESVVDISSDGTSWKRVWSSDDELTADAAWLLQSFDVTSYKSDTFQVRFCYRTGTGGFYFTSGWNVDDVSICEDQACAPGMLAADGGCRWPVSCAELEAADPALPSGEYGIDADGIGQDEPTLASCVMAD